MTFRTLRHLFLILSCFSASVSFSDQKREFYNVDDLKSSELCFEVSKHSVPDWDSYVKNNLSSFDIENPPEDVLWRNYTELTGSSIVRVNVSLPQKYGHKEFWAVGMKKARKVQVDSAAAHIYYDYVRDKKEWVLLKVSGPYLCVSNDKDIPLFVTERHSEENEIKVINKEPQAFAITYKIDGHEVIVTSPYRNFRHIENLVFELGSSKYILISWPFSHQGCTNMHGLYGFVDGRPKLIETAGGRCG